MPANSPLDQTISLSGAAQVKAQLADLASTGSSSLQRLAQSAGAAQTGFNQFGGGVTQAAAVLSGLREHATNAGEGISKISEALLVAAPALSSFLGLASGAGLFELSRRAADTVDELGDLATQLGSTARQFQAFHYALATVGQDTDSANTALIKMISYLGQTDDALRKVSASSASLALEQQATASAANLAVDSARNAAANSAAAYDQSRQAITQAQLAADKASISYYQLEQRIRASNASGEQARINARELRNAGVSYELAVQGIANAQQRSNQAANDAYLASRRVSLAEEQRRATLAKLEEQQDNTLTSTQKWLREIGVASDESRADSTNAVEAFYKILNGLAQVTDKATQAEHAKQIFGRGWARIIDALQAGGTALAEVAKTFEATGLSIDEHETKVAEGFKNALAELNFFIGAIRDFAGLNIAEKLFTPMIKGLNEWIIANATGIRRFFEGFADALALIARVISFTLIPAVEAARAAFRLLMLAANAVAGAINAVFGDVTSGPMVFWLGIIGGAAARFAPLLARITGLSAALGALNGLWTAGARAMALYAAEGYSVAGAFGMIALRLGLIGLLIGGIIYILNNWDSIVEGNAAAVRGFWELLVSIWGWFRDTWVEVFDTLLEKFQGWITALQTYFQSWATWFTEQTTAVSDFFSNAWQTAISYVEGLWNGFVDWLTGAAEAIERRWQQVKQFFIDLWNLIKQVTGASSSAGAPAAGSAGSFAGGGPVRGPGSATSDSIPAWLSNGEYVVKAAAVSRVGVGFLDAVNTGRTAFMAMGGAVRRALGGFVGTARPQHFAAGGLVSAIAGNAGGLAPVHIHLGGATFPLMGERGVVQSLTSAARKASITRAGNTPSWNR